MNSNIRYFLIFVIFIAGPLQNIGLIGYYDTIFLFTSISFYLVINKKKIKIILNKFYLFIYIMLLIIGMLYSETVFYGLLYILAVITPPLIVFVLLSNYKIIIKNSTIEYYLYIQLIAVITQYLLSNIIQINGVSTYDLMYGTLLKGTDHILAYSAMVSLVIFNLRRSLTFKRFLILSILILLTNSKISILLFGSLLLYIAHGNLKSKLLKGSILISLIILLVIFSAQLLDIFQNLNQMYGLRDIEYVDTFFLNAMGNRLAAIVYLVNADLLFFGNGMFSIYDPVLKTFNVGGDYSMLLWLYYDLGIFGFIYFLLITYLYCRNNTIMYFYFVTISLVFNTFSDFPFLIFTIFLSNEFLSYKSREYTKLYYEV